MHIVLSETLTGKVNKNIPIYNRFTCCRKTDILTTPVPGILQARTLEWVASCAVFCN